MELLSFNTIKETKFLNLNETYYSNDGKKGKWVWVERPGNQRAVGIAAIIRETPFNKGNEHLRPKSYRENVKLIVTKEYRVPLEGYEYGLPAGLVDNNEEVLDTAKRELIEETGYEITKVLSITPYIFNSPGMTNESISYVFCEAQELGKQKLEGTEEIEVLLLNQREVRSLLLRALSGQIMLGAKAWFIFSEFSNHSNF